eukprot:scaffold262791_cov15-Prasinocladus_malaysianus.AAC.1
MTLLSRQSVAHLDGHVSPFRVAPMINVGLLPCESERADQQASVIASGQTRLLGSKRQQCTHDQEKLSHKMG